MHSEQKEKRRQDHIITPHGTAHRSTICHPGQRIEPAVLSRHRPKSFRELRALNPHGWIESATFCPPAPLGRMRFQVTVPEPPEYDGALIYLFAGAQDMFLSTVLQPVLQWGCNGDFGGDYWCLACWHADSSGAHCVSDYLKVNCGDEIEGTLSVKCHTDLSCDWKIEAKDLTTGECTSLPVPDFSLLLLFLIGGALEAYSLDGCGEPSLTLVDVPPQCSQYPQSKCTKFRMNELSDLAGNRIYPWWNLRQFEGSGPNCSFGVSTEPDPESGIDTVVLNY